MSTQCAFLYFLVPKMYRISLNSEITAYMKRVQQTETKRL
jgi:hypothetical protein